MMADGNDSVHGSIHAPSPQARLKIGEDALIAHRKRGLVHYTQTTKRMTIVRLKLIPPFGNRVIYEDCSSAVTGLYRMAGLHDPNNLQFAGIGYTGTLCLHGRKVNVPKLGDLVFYGGLPYHHVAIVYSLNPTKVWSHGHEGGPVIEALDYRSDRRQLRRYF